MSKSNATIPPDIPYGLRARLKLVLTEGQG